jgi:hypothetical protein
MRKEEWMRKRGGGESSGGNSEVVTRTIRIGVTVSIAVSMACGTGSGVAMGVVIRSVLAGEILHEECTGWPGIRLHPPLVQQLSDDTGCKSCAQQAK